jgi:Zn-dependent protease
VPIPADSRDNLNRLPYIEQIQQALPLLVVLIMSLSFHEAAHAWAANRLGDPTARQLGRLTLNPLAHIDWIGTVLFPLIALSSGVPLIGWAKPVPVDMRNLREPRRDFALVALAGPVSNLILATGAAVIFEAYMTANSAASDSPGVLAQTLFMAVVMNVMLAVFNMFPIPPLDGGNVLMGLVPYSVARSINWLRPYGFFLIYALMLTGILAAIMSPVQRFLLSFLL